MAMKPNMITIVVFLLVFASATSAMPTEGSEYQDSEFLDEFSGYATEAWNYVAPSLEPLAELWYAQATSNNAPLFQINSAPSILPAQPREPWRDTLHDAQQVLLPTHAISQAELGYPSPSVAHLPSHVYPQSAMLMPSSSVMDNMEWTMPPFEVQPVAYSNADTQNWIENAYTTGERVQPMFGSSANWSDLQHIPPSPFLPHAQPPLTPATPSTPFTSISGEQPTQQLMDALNNPAPFRCDHKGCRFTSQTIQTLRHHQRYHMPEELRPHKCPQCPRRFHCPREVQRHTVIHTLERRYFCTVPSCLYATKGFGRKDHLTRHTRAKHPSESGVQTTDASSSMDNSSTT